MSLRVGINGFGRMGRLGLRSGWGREALSIVRVNETATGAEGSAHLLKFDSVHGTWDVDCTSEGEAMLVGGQRIACSRNAVIGETDWSEIEWYEKDGYVFKDDPNLEVNTAPILFPGIKPMLIREKLQSLLKDNQLYANSFVSDELTDNPDYLFFPDMSRFFDGEFNIK